MAEIAYYKASIYNVEIAGNTTKPRKNVIEASKVQNICADKAIDECLTKLPKSYKNRRVVICLTPCETIDRGEYKMEVALIARTEFITAFVP